MNWFKLVGSTESPVGKNWAEEEPWIFTKVHFPRNKRPNKISNGELIVIYAVASKVLLATQTVVSTAPASKERKGTPGTDEHRWPWEIWVHTHYYCSPLEDAPVLREVAPEFAERHAKKFREGSHWPIEDSEYAQLATAVQECGRPYNVDTGGG